MWKKLLRYFYFSLLFVFLACAPRPKVAPPTLYKEDLTLNEIITKVSEDIEVLKAIADIKIEKNNKPYDFVNASVLIKRPDWVHMRVYKFGMLVRDFVIKKNEMYVLSGKNSIKLKEFAREFYNAVFWWDGMREGLMYREGGEYIIRAENKEIHIDRATLLPVKQEIRALNKNIYATYDEPENNDGYWYQSVIKIYVGDFRFTVMLRKLLKNPSLGEFDFHIPAES